VKCLLTLSHANAAPESGFSLNKAILAAHGNSLEGDTLVSLRIVKGAIRNANGFLQFEIDKALIVSVRHSYQKYQADLEARKKMREDLEKKKREEESRLKRKKEEVEEQKTVADIDRKIKLKRTGIMVAEETISSANAKLQSILLEKNISRVELQKAQSTLQMGLERKSALENEISALENASNQAKKMKK